VQSEIEIFPYGELEGCPVLAVIATAGTSHEELITEALRKKRPGLRALWVKDAEWESVPWDTAMLHFMADERLGSTVIAVRNLEAKGWSSIALYWVADCTSFLADPITIKQLSEKLVALDYVPHLAELIVRRIPASNLKPTLLDELHSTLGVDGIGTIYCPPNDYSYMQSALVQVSKCATPWIVRFDHLTREERKRWAATSDTPDDDEEPAENGI
jgi:hypothetical protein